MNMKAKNRIKVVLAEKEVRSMELVKRLGVSKTTVSRWINNKQQPTLDNLYSVASLLGIDVCDLLVSNTNDERKMINKS